MSIYTSGTWQATPGSEDQFVQAWTAFAAWASAQPGAGTLRLVHDLDTPQRFVSFGEWDDLAAVRSWKSSPEFRERMANILQHVSSFEPTESALVAVADAGEVAEYAAVQIA
jgi:heme-degrading monooxygenase HmoA